MTNKDCIEELATLLDVETTEAHRYLNAFSGAMVAELLANGKLTVRGLGTFSVTHVPPAKKSTGSGSVYTPPRNRLTFDSRISGADDTVRIAVSRAAMNHDEAVRFARNLASVLGGAVQQQREILLNGFGRFSFEQGSYGFVPERSLEELLNREYQDLEEVVVSQDGRVQGSGERKFASYAVPFLALVLIGLVLAVLYGRQVADVVFPPSVAVSERPVKTAVSDVMVDNKMAHAVAPRGSAVDSLVLEKDDYTIVMASFRSETTALKELASLRAKGIISFIWPASPEGAKYYRIITGKFSSRDKAVELLRGMPEKTAGSAYIQHVIKRVVLHGEKEL
jgi:nucleoid DNA-binding protein